MRPKTLRELYEIYREKFLQGSDDDGLTKHTTPINHFERWLERKAILADLSDQNLTAFMWWLVNERGVEKVTANGYCKRLLAEWKYACRQNWIKRWPDVKLLVEPRRVPRAWTMEQLARIIDCCRGQRGGIGPVAASGWWLALINVMWDTSERIGALLALRWADVDLATGWVLCRAESRKGKTADVAYLLHPGTVELLRNIERPYRELVFESGRSMGMVLLWYDKLLQEAGLPHGRKDKFHRIRRSVASHLKRVGGNPTEALHHSDPRITDESYLDPTICGGIQPSQLLPRIER